MTLFNCRGTALERIRVTRSRQPCSCCHLAPILAGKILSSVGWRGIPMTDSSEFDVVVVGGGPGGSTLASLVAMQGHRVLVLEKEHFPRYQIGESLLPSTIHGVCRLTGVSDKLAKAGFPLKRGGSFRWGASPEPWTFAFSISSRMTGPTSFAYQVERSKFDKILLDHARELGAEVREGCTVTDIIDGGDRVTGLRYTDDDGNE